VDAAEAVPEQETRPLHAVCAGEQRGGEAKHRQPAAEKHHYRPAAPEEGFAVREESASVDGGEAVPEQQSASAVATDEVADVIADDGGGGRDDDDRGEVEVPLGCEHRGGGQAGLARDGKAGRFAGDWREVQRELSWCRCVGRSK
jgi:hypothetical protein